MILRVKHLATSVWFHSYIEVNMDYCAIEGKILNTRWYYVENFLRAIRDLFLGIFPNRYISSADINKSNKVQEILENHKVQRMVFPESTCS